MPIIIPEHQRQTKGRRYPAVPLDRPGISCNPTPPPKHPPTHQEIMALVETLHPHPLRPLRCTISVLRLKTRHARQPGRRTPPRQLSGRLRAVIFEDHQIRHQWHPDHLPLSSGHKIHRIFKVARDNFPKEEKGVHHPWHSTRDAKTQGMVGKGSMAEMSPTTAAV